MHVVGHQRIGVQPAAALAQRLAEPVAVGVVVLLGEKAGLAIVAALHDVQRHAIEVDAGAAGHAVTLDHRGE